jgi:hypothetical protein
MMPIKYEQHFLYFDRSVLAQYRASPHISSLKEDDMGGILETALDDVNSDNDLSEDQYVRVRFGFRKLKDNCVCIAGLRYDVQELPEKDQFIWRGNMLNNPQLPKTTSLLNDGFIDILKALGMLKMARGFRLINMLN